MQRGRHSEDGVASKKHRRNGTPQCVHYSIEQSSRVMENRKPGWMMIDAPQGCNLPAIKLLAIRQAIPQREAATLRLWELVVVAVEGRFLWGDSE